MRREDSERNEMGNGEIPIDRLTFPHEINPPLIDLSHRDPNFGVRWERSNVIDNARTG